MQNNLRNRSVALASTFALALTGLVAVAPAAQALAPVELKPKVGVNTGAFITDDFDMSVNVPTVIDSERLAVKIDNPSKEQLQVDVTTVSADGHGFAIRAFTATGTEISLDASRFGLNDGDGLTADVSFSTSRGNVITDNTKRFSLLFNDSDDTKDITSIVIADIKAASAPITTREVELKFQLLDGSGNAFEYGEGNQGDISVQTWVETETTADYTSVDSSTASAVATMKFFDPAGVSVIPSLERFTMAGASTAEKMLGTDQLVGKVRFVRPELNLDQINYDNWDITYRDTTGNQLRDASLSTDRKNVAGTGSANTIDLGGAAYFKSTGVGAIATSSYTVRVTHNSTQTSNTRTFNSVGFTPVTNDTDRDLYITVTDGDNAEQDNTAPSTGVTGDVDPTVELRPGTAAFTYNARLYASNTTDRAKVASQVVIATVTAGSFMPTGTELTVSGSNETLSRADQATVVSGLTDSNGDFAVTVTSSNPVAATSYEVEFVTVGRDGDERNNTVDGTDNAITATYTGADVDGTALTVPNTVLSGATVEVAATVADSYGVATDNKGGDQLYATLQATDTDDLDQTVAVASDGSISMSFTNYVAAGQSDLVNLYLHEGASYTSGTTTIIDSEVLSLYNPSAVAAVNVPASVSGNVTYDDFIVGTASSTNVAPDDTAMTITGTVADSNGQGIPGAVVTVDADGMQLRKQGVGDYFQDSITFSASASGAFTVELWSHTLSPTGVDVTVTSGGQSGTTSVKTFLPTGLSGGDLVFSLDAPANIDVNKTYAIQASLTDKWGNPVDTSGDSVDIVGTGSVEINSKAAGAEGKNFGKDGKVTVFVRSIKDIEGPGTITASLQTGAVYATSATATATVDRSEVTTDVAGTAHDETSFSNEITVDINVGEAAATSSDQKVNAGSFKGYVAVYAKGYEGQRLSAKIGNDWVIVDPIVNNEGANLHRTTDFTGAGVDIAVRIYIDRVLVDTINLTTK